MPIFDKIPYEKAQLPENLKPDEHVFYIPTTKEVFRDYRTFFDRVMVYNTAEWSCSISGKNGFTLREALECEKQSRLEVESFQQSLKVPVLFLTTLIKRRNVADLVDELVDFMKTRFFVNEELTYTEDSEKLPATVKKVRCDQVRPLPARKVSSEQISDDDDDDDECLATIAAQNKNPPPSAYKYEISVKKSGESCAIQDVSFNKLARKKNALSKEKLKMFLKAQCRVGSDGFWKVKSHLMALGLEDDDAIGSFFAFPLPKFKPPVESRRRISKPSASSKKKSKSKSGKSKKVQEKKEKKKAAQNKKQKVAPPKPVLPPKPLTKEEIAALKRLELEQRKLMKEQEHQRLIEEKKLERERQKEERIREKQRMLEEKKRQMEYMRQYNKPRDDMMCDDLRPLPPATSLRLESIDTKLFPEIVYVIEFCHIFREFLELDFSQLTIGKLQMAVKPYSSSQALDGLFYDLVTVMLRAIFDMRKAENEDEEFDTSFISSADLEQLEADIQNENLTFSLRNVQRMSKAYAQQLTSRLGFEMDMLPINTATLSEVIRLHIWSSPALRQHFASDEPAIDFCHLNSDIVAKLSRTSVFDLDPASKLKLLRLLMDQLLVFSDFRDFIEESFDKVKEDKIRLSELQGEHARWVKARDFSAVREKAKLKPPEPPADDSAKPPETDEEKKHKREVKTITQRLQKCLSAFQHQEMEPFVEHTRRSSRRGQSTGSGKSASEQLLDDNENYMLECNSVMLTHLSEEDCTIFDRWRAQVVSKRLTSIEQEIQEISNDIIKHQRVYNLRPLGKDRAFRRYWTFSTLPGLFVEEPDQEIPDNLLVPIQQLPPKDGQPSSSIVPEPLDRTWGLFANRDEIEKLIESLNPRGFRESALKASLVRQFGSICSTLEECPVEVLTAGPLSAEPTIDVNKEFDVLLRDQLLELEEKLYCGSLGSLQVANRQSWKTSLESGSFKPGVKEITYGSVGSESVSEDPPPTETIDVHGLAIALLQIEKGVDRKFVKAPLWPNVSELATKGRSRVKKLAEEVEDENSKSSDHAMQKPVIACWEESLMRCTSLSQIFLHLAILDSSILWSRSILKAHCRICRRRADPASMLLCDGCNSGYHCYCLRPPLKKIPDGDWFCMECKPENFTRSRLNRRAAARNPRRPREEMYEEEIVQAKQPAKTRRGRVVEEEEPEEQEEEPEVEEAEQHSLSTASQAGSDGEAEESGEEDGSESSEEGSEEDGEEGSSEEEDEDDEEEGSEAGSGSEEGSNEAVGSDRSEDGSIEDGSAEASDSGDVALSDDSEVEDGMPSEDEMPEEPTKSRKSSSKRSLKVHPDADYAESNGSVRSLTPVCALCSARAADDMAYVRCDTCETVYHLDCVVPSPLTRKPRGGWNCFSCTSKPAKRQSAVSLSNRETPHQPAPKRDAFEYASSASSNSNHAWGTGSRSDLSVKKAEQLLGELVKHEDAWLFLKPVSKKQVPDYFDVIKHPMDFGTIRVKINESPYKDASALLDDCQLVFDNCFTYNEKGDEVFSLGLRVFKFFMRRLRDLQLDASWPHFKSANSRLSKLTGEGNKRSANGHAGHDHAPAKQSRR